MKQTILRSVICIVATTTLLSACHPHHPHYPRGGARISIPGVDVHVGDEGGHRGGPPHCPPGHRKKGWC